MSERTQYERVETVDGIMGKAHFIRLKSGRELTYWEAVSMVEAAMSALGTGFSRAFKLAVAQAEGGGDLIELSPDYYLEALEYRIDRVEEHMAALRHYLAKLRGSQDKRDRIRRLRNVTGRTPEEAAAFLRKADELEKRLED